MAPLPLSEHWSSRRPGETLTSLVLGAGSQWNTFTGTFSFPHVKSLPIGTTPHVELPAFWKPGRLFLFFSRDCGFVTRPLARSHHVSHRRVGAGEAGGFLAPVLRYRHGAWRSPRSQPARGGGAPAPPSAPQAREPPSAVTSPRAPSSPSRSVALREAPVLFPGSHTLPLVGSRWVHRLPV